MTVRNVLMRHPILLAHAVGMLMVWIAVSFLGGYDRSPSASFLFFFGQILCFFRWLIIEVAFSLKDGDFVKNMGLWIPSFLALVLAHFADLLITSRRAKKLTGVDQSRP